MPVHTIFERKKSYAVTPLQVNSFASTEHIINDPIAQHEKQVFKKCWFRKINVKPFLGCTYAILSSIFIIISSVFVKKLAYINPGQLSMIRNIGVMVGNLPIAVYSVDNILGPRKHWCILIIRSFLGATALYLNLLAYRYLPLAEASIVLSTAPAVVTVSARIYLKEECGLMQTFAIVLTVVGMLLSIRIPVLLQEQSKDTNQHDLTYFIGLACALGCVLILSITFISLRKMQDVHFSVIQLYFGVLGTLENGIITGTFSGFSMAVCGWDNVQVILIGVFGFLGHAFLTLALQTEAAGIVSVVRSSTDIMVAMVLQVLFFDLKLDMYVIGGALLVIISVSTIGIRKWLITLPKDDVRKKKLKFLLR